MNTQLIELHWDGIGDRRRALVETFYGRLFARYPRFRPLFPESIDHQMDKMVQTLELVARESDAPALIRPHLLKIGARHSEYNLTSQDFEHFVSVLLEVLGEYNRSCWSAACAQAWREALAQVVLPYMAAGMTDLRRSSESKRR